jgi:hypothetical protein
MWLQMQAVAIEKLITRNNPTKKFIAFKQQKVMVQHCQPSRHPDKERWTIAILNPKQLSKMDKSIYAFPVKVHEKN